MPDTNQYDYDAQFDAEVGLRDEQVRQCTRCNRVLPISKFHVDKRRGKPGTNCMDCMRERNKVRNRMLRMKVLSHYCGGEAPFCKCCNEDTPEFLALDHINGGGRKQREKLKSVTWWSWIIRNNYPPEFQVLCHNCNQSYGVYGYCPHHTSASKLTESFYRYDEYGPNRSYKLTQEDVDEIRRIVANGEPQNRVAERFRVSRATICCIVGRKRWAGGERRAAV